VLRTGRLDHRRDHLLGRWVEHSPDHPPRQAPALDMSRSDPGHVSGTVPKTWLL
jgi:hypothetical protein